MILIVIGVIVLFHIMCWAVFDEGPTSKDAW